MNTELGELEELYQEVILDHSRRPRNFGELPNASVKVHGDNPSCGDEIHLAIKFDGNGGLEEIKFNGHGCAISQASASLMTMKLKGKSRADFCRTGPEDVGLHTVCVQMTREFLDFSVLDGNDLVTPVPEWGFPGLKPGDKWCVCVTRWKSALEHNRAAPVDLEATHASALEFITLEDLKAHAVK